VAVGGRRRIAALTPGMARHRGSIRVCGAVGIVDLNQHGLISGGVYANPSPSTMPADDMDGRDCAIMLQVRSKTARSASAARRIPDMRRFAGDIRDAMASYALMRRLTVAEVHAALERPMACRSLGATLRRLNPTEADYYAVKIRCRERQYAIHEETAHRPNELARFPRGALPASSTTVRYVQASATAGHAARSRSTRI